MTIIPNTTGMRLEVLYAVFTEFAQDGQASFQMDADRGGLFVQLSNREWPDGIEERVERSGQAEHVTITPGKYSTVICIRGDVIES